MESQPQNTEFRNNPENFHPWVKGVEDWPFHTSDMNDLLSLQATLVI